MQAELPSIVVTKAKRNDDEVDSQATAVPSSRGSPSLGIPPCSPQFRRLSESTEDKIIVPSIGQPDAVHRVVEGQIPSDLLGSLSSDFSESEIFEIAHLCDAYVADVNNDAPKALWIFGPPAVGKSTLMNEKGQELFGRANNAVTIDGDIFRRVHKGFQMVALHGIRNRLVHKDAWEIFRKKGHMDRIKDGLVDHAISHRMHLKIPESAVKESRVESMLHRLEKAGYEMHAICLWAPKCVTTTRGRPRSIKDGKVFSTKSFPVATANTLHFGLRFQEELANGNAHFKSVAYFDNTIFPSRAVHVSEFEKLTKMADGDAAQHLHVCEVTKLDREKSDVAASEDRARTGSGTPFNGANGAHRRCSASSDVLDANATFFQNSSNSVQNIRLRLEGFIIGVLITLGLLLIQRYFSTPIPQAGSEL